MRVEWDLSGFSLDHNCFGAHFTAIADRFQMTWRLALSNQRPQVAIFASKYDHCLIDLLYRHQSGELACDIPLVISNHRRNRRLAEFHNIPYYHLPLTKEDKDDVERKQQALLTRHNIDLIVLARYMQILSAEFICPLSSTHHQYSSFFPASFPRRQALPSRLRTRGKVNWCRQPLCHRNP